MVGGTEGREAGQEGETPPLTPEFPPACLFLGVQSSDPHLFLLCGLLGCSRMSSASVFGRPPIVAGRGSPALRSSMLQTDEKPRDLLGRQLKSPGWGVSATEVETVTRRRE